jgi:hypothetical protein
MRCARIVLSEDNQMIYRPTLQWIAENAKNYPFSTKRWFHLPSQEYNGWLIYNKKDVGFLRERFAIPVLSEREMKEGFYFVDMVH